MQKNLNYEQIHEGTNEHLNKTEREAKRTHECESMKKSMKRGCGKVSVKEV